MNATSNNNSFYNSNETNSQNDRNIIEKSASINDTNIINLQQELDILKKRYELLVNTTLDGVWEWDINSDTTFVSDKLLILLGIDKNLYISNQIRFYDYVHKNDIEAIEEGIKNCLESGKNYNLEYRLKVASGEYRYFLSRASVIYDNQNNPIKMLGTLIDIDEQKKNQLRLELKNYVIEHTSTAILWFDKLGKITRVNEAAEKLYNFTHDEFLKLSIYDIEVDIDEQFWKNEYSELKDKSSINLQSKHINKFGQVFDVEIQANYFKLNDEELVFAFIKDVTDFNLIQNKLKLQDYLIQNTSTAVAWIDEKGQIKGGNKALEAVWGYKIDELVNISLSKINPLFSRELWSQSWAKLKNEKSLFTKGNSVRNDGKVIDVEIVENFVEIDGNELNYVFVTDVTENNQNLQNLKLYEYVIQNTLTPVVWINKQGVIINTNKSYLDLLGYDNENELVGFDMSHLDDDYSGEIWGKHWDELEKNKTLNLITKSKKKDGSKVDVEVNANYIKFGDIELNCAFVNDVTEKNKNLQNLQLFEYVIQNTITPVVWINEEGKIVNANKSYLDLLGYNIDELLNLDIMSLDDDFHSLTWKEHWADIKLKTSINFNTKNRRKDGILVDINVTANYVQIGDIELNCAFITDITEKLAYEFRIKESERVLNTLVENIPLAIQFLDKEGALFKYNRGFEELFGIPQGINHGYGINVLTHPLMKDLGVQPFYQKVYDTKQIVNFETETVLQQSKKYDFENSFKTILVKNTTFPILDENGDIDFVASILVDTTEIREHEKQRELAQKKYYDLLNNINGVVWEADANTFEFNFISNQAVNVLGYPTEMWLNNADFWPSLIIEEDRDFAVNYCVACTKNLEDHIFEYRMRKSNGDIVWIKDIVKVEAIDGKPTTLRGIMIEITEQKEAEIELIELKNRLNAIIVSTKDIVFALDYNLNYIAFNQNHFVATKAGYGTEPIMGEYMPGFVTNPKDKEYIENNLRKALDGEYLSVVQEFGNNDLQKFYLEANVNPIKNTKNEITGVAVFVRDITLKVRAEKEIKELNSRLSAVIESTKDRVYALDNSLNFLIFNQNFAKSIKNRYNIDISVGSSFNEILGNRSDKDFVLDKFNRGLNGEFVETTQEIIDANNKKSYLEVVCNPIFNEDNFVTGIAVFVKDVTEKKQIENALVESEHRFRKLLNDIPNVAVQGYDREGIIKYWNKASEKYYGYSAEEALNNNIHILLNLPEEVENATKHAQNMFDTKTPNPTEELLIKKKDGSFLPILASNAYIELSDGTAEMFCVDVDLTQIKIAENEIKKLVQELILKNELVEVNLEQKNSLLSQIEYANLKLNEIIREKDKFFSIIAHDLRSPLSGFMALSKEMADNIDELTQEQIIEFAKSLKKSSENVYQLLENLLKWSQFQRGTLEFSPEIVYLKHVVQNNIAILLSKSTHKEISLVCNIEDNVTLIADIKMLNTILRNLLSNAIKFTPRGGKIIVGTVEKNSQYYKEDHITFYIHDNGIGIPENIINNIFTLNSHTARAGTESESSSGLGLILCKEFITKHQGEIYIESTENIGSTFFISLPIEQNQNS